MTNRYIEQINGAKFFSGNPDNEEVFRMTVSMAENCSAFQNDVEEEIVYEGRTTCYNCRYRRWGSNGFSCYQDFPDRSHPKIERV